MSASRWARIQDLFEQLEGLESPQREQALLRLEPDASLRNEVLALFTAATEEAEVSLGLRTLTARESTATDSGLDTGPPDLGEGLRLLEELGTGGFSTVYRARRSIATKGEGEVDPVAQQVAVKLFHGRLVDPQDRARFKREQRILASLHHPGIVGFLDAGVTPAGQPYLVMEEVVGETITQYCDARQLSVAARLRLLMAAGEALQNAHEHMVVHLDIKPSNMLVTTAGQVKLLDFGTAKLLDFAEGAAMTRQITPSYASPERLSGEPGTVRSDVYSLGLVLFELLSGRLPFRDASSVLALAGRAQGTTQACLLGEACTRQSAELRGTTYPRLQQELRGDLELICRQALDPVPSQRYASPAELTADVARYLEGEPVLAHPPSNLYRLRKFAGRNAVALAMAAGLCAVLAGAGAYVWRERMQGVERLEQARAMAKYLLFDLYDQVAELPGSTGVRARMLGQARQHLDALSQQSGASEAVRLETAAGHNRLAEIQGVSGSSSLADTPAASVSLRRARQLVDAILAEQPQHKAALLERARNGLLQAKLENWQRRNPKAARETTAQARADLEAAKPATDSKEWLRLQAVLAQGEADAAEFEGKFAEEEQVANVALGQLRQWPPAMRQELDFALRMQALLKRKGNAHYGRKQFAEALAAYAESHQLLEQFRSQHPQHPELLYALANATYDMAYCHGDLGRAGAMTEWIERSLEVTQGLLEQDAENASLRRSYWNKRQALAEALALQRDYRRALAEQQRVVEARKQAERAKPESSLVREDVVLSEATQASMLAASGQAAQACALATDCLRRSAQLQRAGRMTPKNWAGQERQLRELMVKQCK